MDVFIALFDEASKKAADLLEAHYPDHFQHPSFERIYFLASDDISEKIAVNIGIKGENRVVSGMILKLEGAYSGYTDGSIWEWLEKFDRG